MKILFTILTFTSSIVFGQTLEKRIAQKYCDCFSKIDQSVDKESVINEYSDNCLNQVILDFKDEIESFKDTIQGNSDYEKGRRFGTFISEKVQVEMIYTCDKYFFFLENLRSGIFKTVDKEKEKIKIKEITNRLKNESSAKNYFDRATSYFGLKEFRLSKRDLDKVITLDKNYAPAYLLKGFILELNGQYKEAVDNYSTCKSLTNKSEIEVFIAMSKRKEKQK